MMFTIENIISFFVGVVYAIGILTIVFNLVKVISWIFINAP